MVVYRLTRKKYAHTLSGKGASFYGNRWNSKGVEMIYCAGSRALAMAEVAVHVTLATLPRDFMMVGIEIPDAIKVTTLHHNDLPEEWNVFPHPLSTQKIGDRFIHDNAFCVLRVPSAVVKGDVNHLINPLHKEFDKINIIHAYDFPFDKRIFR